MKICFKASHNEVCYRISVKNAYKKDSVVPPIIRMHSKLPIVNSLKIAAKYIFHRITKVISCLFDSCDNLIFINCRDNAVSYKFILSSLIVWMMVVLDLF